MIDADITAVRAAMTTRALSTLGAASPEWDNAVRELLRLEALSRSDSAFGPYNKANDTFDWAKANIEAAHGRNWREVPEAKAAMHEAWEQANEANGVHVRDYLRPLWAAQRRVVLTPAPTLNAALFKSELMAWEEVWNDSELKRDGFEIVAEELARFAGGAQ